MLSHTFDPFLFPQDRNSELNFYDNVLLHSGISARADLSRAESIARITNETKMTSPSPKITSPDGETTEVLPDRPPSPMSDSHSAESEDLAVKFDSAQGTSDVETSKDSEPDKITQPANEGYDEVNHSSTESSEDELPQYALDEQSDSDSDSVVSSIPYEDNDQDEREATSATMSNLDQYSITWTPMNMPAATTSQVGQPGRAKEKGKEVFDAVTVPVCSFPQKKSAFSRPARSGIISKASSMLATALSRAPSVQSQAQPQLSTPTLPATPRTNSDGNTNNAATITPDPVSAVGTPPLSTSTETYPNASIKADPDKPETVQTLESHLSTLTTQLRSTRSQLAHHNSNLDTLSPRLNNLITHCNTLSSERKTLLAQRKGIQHSITVNREELRERQADAEKLQARQSNVMDERDNAQYELNALMKERKDVRKQLGRVRYEEALEKRFGDRGCREVARRMGWRPSPEEALGEADGESETDSESEGSAGGDTGGRGREWVRVANAIMEGDQNVDFEDLTMIQEELGVVDRKVKEESEEVDGQDMAVVTREGTPAAGSESAAQAQSANTPEVKVECHSNSTDIVRRRKSASPESQGQVSASDTIPHEHGIEDGLGNFTMENLQAHFKAMEEHRKEVAKMLSVLAGAQNGMKRKNAAGTGGPMKKRKVAGGKKLRRGSQVDYFESDGEEEDLNDRK